MKAILKIVSGKMNGEYLVLTEGATHTIGRSNDVDWNLIDDQVSRLHCVVWVRHGKVYVRDFGSRNGTYLDETQLSPGDRLNFASPDENDPQWKPGIPLFVGDTHIELIIEQQPDADRPVIKITTPGAIPTQTAEKSGTQTDPSLLVEKRQFEISQNEKTTAGGPVAKVAKPIGKPIKKFVAKPTPPPPLNPTSATLSNIQTTVANSPKSPKKTLMIKKK